MKFIHSADWQLGARFIQFGPSAQLLREARLQTLERALLKADELEVDAFLVAGDLFEDGQVEDAVIQAALSKFGKVPEVPVFILPGNHDPDNGPGSVWYRKPLLSKPENVRVITKAEVLDCGGAHLIASPLNQKLSTIDPSLKIAELARGLTGDRIRLGITHGALAIPSRHQPNDFPIALDAATRAGLDYLAIGHWHSWQSLDRGRLVMPGTPEPDGFDQEDSGFVALVEIDGRGEAPRVEKVPVAALHWKTLELDFLEVETAWKSLEQRLSELMPNADRTVLRVKLLGNVSHQQLAETRLWLEEALGSFLVSQILDLTSSAFSPPELDEFQRSHPLLAQIIADLTQIEHLATNKPLPSGIDPGQVIPMSETQALLSNARIELNQLDADFFRLAHQLLSDGIQKEAR